jgi:hypothetical protein
MVAEQRRQRTQAFFQQRKHVPTKSPLFQTPGPATVPQASSNPSKTMPVKVPDLTLPVIDLTVVDAWDD